MLIKNSLIVGLSTLIKGFCSFLVIAVYTRLLSPAAYGDYMIVMSVVIYVDAFAFQAVRMAVIRHITHHRQERDTAFLANSMMIYGVLAVICLIFSFVFFQIGIIDPGTHQLIYELIGVLIVCEAFSNIVISLARVRLHYGLFLVLNIIKPVLTLVAGALLIMAGMGFEGAVFGFLIGITACCLLGLFRLDDFKAIRFFHFDPGIIREIAVFSSPLVLMFMMQSGLLAADRFMLEAFIGGDATGLYVAAQGLPQKLLAILAGSIHLAAYPLSVHALDHEGRESCHKQLRMNFMLLFGVLLPSVIGIIVTAPALSNIFVGEAFRPFLRDYLWIFAALSFLSCMAQYYFLLAFNLTKKNHLLIYPYAAALAMNVTLGYLLIQRYGVDGMVMGTIAANGFLAIAIYVMSRRVFSIPVPWKAALQIAVASVLMGGTVYYADMGAGSGGFIVSVLIGGAVYGLAVWGMNVGDVRAKGLVLIRPYIRKLRLAR